MSFNNIKETWNGHWEMSIFLMNLLLLFWLSNWDLLVLFRVVSYDINKKMYENLCIIVVFLCCCLMRVGLKMKMDVLRKGNENLFYLFLLYVFIIFCYLLVIIILKWIYMAINLVFMIQTLKSSIQSLFLLRKSSMSLCKL